MYIYIYIYIILILLVLSLLLALLGGCPPRTCAAPAGSRRAPWRGLAYDIIVNVCICYDCVCILYIYIHTL